MTNAGSDRDRSGAEGSPDAALLARVREGDERAAHELFTRYAALLRRRAARRLPPDAQARFGASDVVQDALISAFLSLGDFEPEDPEAFRRWLLRILGNRLQDEIRRVTAGARDIGVETGLGPDAMGEEGTPSVVLMAREERAAIWSAVEALPEDQRRTVELVHLEQLGIAEVADRLGRSVAAARKLYSRALKRLAAELGVGSRERRDDARGA